jgi:hypothetical protein
MPLMRKGFRERVVAWDINFPACMVSRCHPIQGKIRVCINTKDKSRKKTLTNLFFP